MKVIYPGPRAARDIPTLGLTCPAGVEVDVPADVGRSLVAQGWHKPSKTKKSDDSDDTEGDS